ncbi:MAG: L,D-transpeptidase family protein [Solirubrobacteraceae bacterium]
MANVSYLRTPGGDGVGQARSGERLLFGGRAPRGRYVFGAAVLAVLIAAAAGALIVSSSHASLTVDGTALARVGMPAGGGSVQSVSAVTGPHSRRVPVSLRGNQIWPTKLVPAGERLTLDVVVQRPGWISWLSGRTETLHVSLQAPVASLTTHYLTVRGHAPLQLRFKTPVAVFATGPPGHLKRRILSPPASTVTLSRSTSAGTAFVAAAPRTWESSQQAMVSWFPAGGAATAVASPAPGSTIKPGTPITLTFSKPVAKALGSHRPPVSPVTTGAWREVNSHTITFTPTGYGYGLGAKVGVALPSGVRLVGGQQGSSASGGKWSVPGGSTLRAQQLLALLGYLPLKFNYHGAGVGLTTADQLSAAVSPPAGKFSWRWGNTPSALKGFWSPGASGELTRGALMAFETDRGLPADGVAGPVVWKSLISSVLAGRHSSFGYTFVSVSVASQSLTLWHNGRDVIGSTPVNTGIPSAPTATGTYPVYEHLPVTTMSGTNPDGSHYHDTGIPYVSYFNGGDALHGFTRASYGSPQSLGCVEMPFAVAGKIYPYTPIGTLVHVA